jgi:hypothetical protein
LEEPRSEPGGVWLGRNSTSNVGLSGLADSTFCPVIHLPLANPMKDRKQKVIR